MELNTLTKLSCWGSLVGNKYFSVLFLFSSEKKLVFAFLQSKKEEKEDERTGEKKVRTFIYRSLIFFFL